MRKRALRAAYGALSGAFLLAAVIVLYLAAFVCLVLTPWRWPPRRHWR